MVGEDDAVGGKERLNRIAGDRYREIRVLRSSWYVEGSYCIACDGFNRGKQV